MVNEWTRNDLPSAGGLAHTYAATSGDIIERFEAIVDELVWRLNAHHPKPTPGLLSNAADCVLDAEYRASAAKADAARWRRAHEIVEGERDLARDRCREAGRERDAAVRVKGEAFDRAVRAERDRDVWKSRAEAAESRTAPAVTRDEVWRVVAAHDPGDDELAVCRVNRLTDAVCALFGVEAEPADPVTEKARELYRVATPDARWETVADEYRRIARHVLGQEETP